MNFSGCLRDINRKSSADAQNERLDEANIDSSIEIIMFIIRIQSDLISVCFSIECIMHSLVVYAKKAHRNGNNNLSCVAKNSANNECFRCFSGPKLCYHCQHDERVGVGERKMVYVCHFSAKVLCIKQMLMNCSRVSFDFKADDVEQNFHLCFMVRVP
jgi:hypothetical protein